MTTSPTTTDHVVHLSRTIKADPATVFRAWTERDQLLLWSCPVGVNLDDVAVDLRVGGRYKLAMRSPDGRSHTAVGEYLAIDPPRRLRYTWRWEEDYDDVGGTVVTVDFEPCEGGTRVVLVHERLPSEAMRQAHDEGWSSCLDRLQALPR